MKKDNEKFLKAFVGFFIVVVVFIILSNLKGVIAGFVDSVRW